MADVNINVSARDMASGVFERIAKNLRTMQMESRRAGEGALERALGSGRGATGAVADYLGVGLQAIVVDQIGNAFKNATAKALEMQQQVATGGARVTDMVGEMAKGIPILGGFVQGWENVIEMITGARSRAAALGEELDRQAARAEQRNANTAKLLPQLADMERRTMRRAYYANADQEGLSPEMVAGLQDTDTYLDKVEDLKKMRGETTDRSVQDRIDRQIDRERTAFEAETARKGRERLAKQHENTQKAFIEESKNAEEAQKLYIKHIAESAMGPFLPEGKKADGVSPMNLDTLTPDLVLGQGSGAAARQRDEALARDDAARKQLDATKEQTAVLREAIAVFTNPPAGPPVLAGAF